MTDIYFMRHGESKANEKDIWGGDFPLSERGKMQATGIILPVEPEIVITSSKIRAIETAEIGFPQHKKIISFNFDEIDFGGIESTIPPQEVWDFFARDLQGALTFYGGDNLGKRMAEVQKGIEFILSNDDVQTNIIIVAHDMLIRTYLQYIQGKELTNARHDIKELNNCGYVKVAYKGLLPEKITFQDGAFIELTKEANNG